MPLYNRIVQLLVRVPGQAGVFIEDLRIRFQVKKTNRGEPNLATIEVSNLAESTRNALGKTGTVATLQAGYRDSNDGPRIIAEMDVVDVRSIIVEPEVTTVIVCGDGVNALTSNKASHSYKGGTSAKSIIADVVKFAGLTLRDMAGVDDDTYNNGFSEAGPLRDILDKLTGKVNSRWSIQEGEVQITPLDKPASTSIVSLSPSSGLLGSPTRMNKIGEPRSPGQKDGWVATSLLRPDIKPDSIVKIESRQVNGQFRVESVTHTGDNRGEEFTTVLEVVEYD